VEALRDNMGTMECCFRETVAVLQVEQSRVLVKEGGVQLTLTIVDTPGFGDAVDNSNW
jgi:septin family protein